MVSGGSARTAGGCSSSCPSTSSLRRFSRSIQSLRAVRAFRSAEIVGHRHRPRQPRRRPRQQRTRRSGTERVRAELEGRAKTPTLPLRRGPGTSTPRALQRGPETSREASRSRAGYRAPMLLAVEAMEPDLGTGDAAIGPTRSCVDLGDGAAPILPPCDERRRERQGRCLEPLRTDRASFSLFTTNPWKEKRSASRASSAVQGVLETNSAAHARRSPRPSMRSGPGDGFARTPFQRACSIGAGQHTSPKRSRPFFRSPSGAHLSPRIEEPDADERLVITAWLAQPLVAFLLGNGQGQRLGYGLPALSEDGRSVAHIVWGDSGRSNISLGVFTAMATQGQGGRRSTPSRWTVTRTCGETRSSAVSGPQTQGSPEGDGVRSNRTRPLGDRASSRERKLQCSATARRPAWSSSTRTRPRSSAAVKSAGVEAAAT